MNRLRSSMLGAIALGTSACAAMFGVHKVPLKHSSVDFHSGTPHAAQIQAADQAAVIRDITALAEKRGLTLAANECNAERCEVTYNGASNSQAKTMGTGVTTNGNGTTQTSTINMTVSARYFATVAREGQGFRVEMIGVPLINATPSCPDVLASRGRCTAEMFNVRGEQTPAQSFKGIWGVDISGQAEADVIGGIFAELALAAPGAAGAQAASTGGEAAGTVPDSAAAAAPASSTATATGSVPAQ